jgi:hypothetical protein
MRDAINSSLPASNWLISKPGKPIGESCGYSTRVKLGIAFIVFVILTPTLRQLPYTLSAFRALPQTDDISQYERRFTDVKHFLPPDQPVSYRDEFDKFSEQCKAFFLAQYSLAPTVLVALDSKCRSSDEVSAHRARLVLDNFHDPRNEPYLLRLFPNTDFPPHNNLVSLHGGRLAGTDDIVLLHDVDLEERLHARIDK